MQLFCKRANEWVKDAFGSKQCKFDEFPSKPLSQAWLKSS